MPVIIGSGRSRDRLPDIVGSAIRTCSGATIRVYRRRRIGHLGPTRDV